MNNIDAKVHVLGTNGTLDGDDTVLREHVLYLDGGKYFKIDNLESSIVNPEMNTSKGFSLSFWIKHGGMLICIINVMQGCQQKPETSSFLRVYFEEFFQRILRILRTVMLAAHIAPLAT